MRFWFIVLIALSGFTACSREEEKSASPSQSLPAPEPANPVAPIVADGDSKEVVTAWSEPTKAALKALAHALIEEEGVPDSLSETLRVSDLAAFTETEIYEGDSVRVTERVFPQEGGLVEMEGASFLTLVRRLVAIEPGAGHYAKFKLYGIGQEGERLKTRQRLMAKGAEKGQAVKSYAIVDALWDLPGSGAAGAAQLAEIRFSSLRRNTLVRQETRLVDKAPSVFAGNVSWSEQLAHGMNTWARHVERSLTPDFLGYHGVAMGDVNGDGLEDVYLCQAGGLPNLLFLQQADGTLTDVSARAGVDWLDNSTAALLVDLDNDGDRDLSVATRGAFLIMENDGAGRFTLRERLSKVANGYSPTAADIDLDGDLDLLVLRYTSDEGTIGDFPTPHPFHSARNGGANVLLRNEGDFIFADATDDVGLGVENYRFSFAASWEDYDNDGDPDLYIANDFGPNQLFKNEGEYFLDETGQSGSHDWGFGMSATWGDYDRDGYMDLYVSSMFSGAGNQIVAQEDFNPTMDEATRRKYLKMVRGNSLLKNAGGQGFTDVTDPMHEGFAGWAWGSTFADLNNDGWEDLYVANGYITQPDTDDL